jgi:hypothetical protein
MCIYTYTHICTHTDTHIYIYTYTDSRAHIHTRKARSSRDRGYDIIFICIRLFLTCISGEPKSRIYLTRGERLFVNTYLHIVQQPSFSSQYIKLLKIAYLKFQDFSKVRKHSAAFTLENVATLLSAHSSPFALISHTIAQSK